jgi:hypothetical protein
MIGRRLRCNRPASKWRARRKRRLACCFSLGMPWRGGRKPGQPPPIPKQEKEEIALQRDCALVCGFTSVAKPPLFTSHRFANQGGRASSSHFGRNARPARPPARPLLDTTLVVVVVVVVGFSLQGTHAAAATHPPSSEGDAPCCGRGGIEDRGAFSVLVSRALWCLCITPPCGAAQGPPSLFACLSFVAFGEGIFAQRRPRCVGHSGQGGGGSGGRAAVCPCIQRPLWARMGTGV